MMHTGDEYERRARAARHTELRALKQAFSALLFRGPVSRANRHAGLPRDTSCANDRVHRPKRAA